MNQNTLTKHLLLIAKSRLIMIPKVSSSSFTITLLLIFMFDSMMIFILLLFSLYVCMPLNWLCIDQSSCINFTKRQWFVIYLFKTKVNINLILYQLNNVVFINIPSYLYTCINLLFRIDIMEMCIVNNIIDNILFPSLTLK